MNLLLSLFRLSPLIELKLAFTILFCVYIAASRSLSLSLCLSRWVVNLVSIRLSLGRPIPSLLSFRSKHTYVRTSPFVNPYSALCFSPFLARLFFALGVSRVLEADRTKRSQTSFYI